MADSLIFKKLPGQDFNSFILKVGNGKRKIVVLGDQPFDEEAGKNVLSELRFKTLKNVVNYVIENLEKKRVPINATFIFTAASNFEGGGGNTKNMVYNILADIEPDAIMCVGSKAAKAVFFGMGASETDFYGRLVKVKIPVLGTDKKKVKTRALYSVPIKGWTDPKPSIKGSDGGGYVNLIGQVTHHLTTCITGEHPGTIVVPDKPKHTFIDTLEKFDAFYKKLVQCSVASIDTETTGLGIITEKIVSTQIMLVDDKDPLRCDETNCYFIPMDHKESPWISSELDRIKRKLKHYFEFGESKYHIYTNSKFDVEMFYNSFGVRWYNHRIYDSQAGEYFLDENGKETTYVGGYKYFQLASIEMRYGYYRSDLQISKSDRSNMANKPMQDIAEYGMMDVITQTFIHWQQRKIAKERGYEKFMHNVIDQMGNTFLVFSMMENYGNGVDLDYIQQLQDENSIINKGLRENLEKLKLSRAAQNVNQKILDERGWKPEGLFGDAVKPWLFDINLEAHKHMLFTGEMKLAAVEYGKDGKTPSYAEKFQSHYKKVPEVKMFTDIKKVKTIRDTFSTGLYNRLITDPDAIKDKRIRSSYKLLQIITGRTSCFVADTPIAVLKGSGIKPISEIVAGEWVWSINPTTLMEEPRRVVRAWKTGKRNTIIVHYSDVVSMMSGNTKMVELTPEHLLMLGNGVWIKAKHLRYGDAIRSYGPLFNTGPGQHLSVIERIEKGQRNVDVYDLEVEENHNFIANGLCAHNSTNPNLQNIPSRGIWAKVIKRVFAAPKGKIILKPDYSAHEVRGLGNVSRDQKIADAFEGARKAIVDLRTGDVKDLKALIERWKTDSDLHIQNVKIFFNKVVDKLHALRYAIKAVIFGTIYGLSAGSLGRGLYKDIRKWKEIKAEMKALKKTIKELEKAIKKAEG